jgi:hypothetical protein
MMVLPDRFEFTQSSLQDYYDCKKRFFLRYLLNVTWPAVQSEPVLENELHIRRGEQFHHLVHQYLMGVPVDLLTASCGADDDAHLSIWWQSFIRIFAAQQVGKRHAEYTLFTPLSGYRLSARYDLVMLTQDKQLVIYDWKTSLTRPRQAWLTKRLQTRIYPFILVGAGENINQGKPVRPEQVSMIFWFPQFPDRPVQFHYSTVKYQEDTSLLKNLVDEICKLPESGFEMTTHVEYCQYCVYRSLCDRGISAGSVLDNLIDFETQDLPLDLEQISEIAF